MDRATGRRYPRGSRDRPSAESRRQKPTRPPVAANPAPREPNLPSPASVHRARQCKLSLAQSFDEVAAFGTGRRLRAHAAPGRARRSRRLPARPPPRHRGSGCHSAPAAPLPARGACASGHGRGGASADHRPLTVGGHAARRHSAAAESWSAGNRRCPACWARWPAVASGAGLPVPRTVRSGAGVSLVNLPDQTRSQIALATSPRSLAASALEVWSASRRPGRRCRGRMGRLLPPPVGRQGWPRALASW